MAQDRAAPVKLPSPRPRLNPDARALLGYLAALAVLFYLPLLLGLRTFPNGDFNQHFLPFSLFQRSEILAGRLPLWNPYTYAGHPFLADVEADVFYPLSNLTLGLSLPWADPTRASTGSKSRRRCTWRWPASSPIYWRAR